MTPKHAGAVASIRRAAGALMCSVVSIGLVAAAVPTVRADTQISSLAFGDYYYNVQGSGIAQDENAFRLNRVLFTVDGKMDETFSAKLITEADGSSTVNGSGKMAVFLRQAYVGWTDFVPNGQFTIGLVPTPAWANSEMIWGYRAVEKTALDLRGFAASSDIGLGLQGAFGEGALGYHVNLVNGNAQRPENDRGKRVYAAFPWREERWVVEPMMDANLVPGNRDQLQFKLLGGWLQAEGALGAEVVYRMNLNAGAGGRDVVPVILSAYGRWNASEKLTTLGRIDWFDPDTEDDALGYVQDLFIAGIDYHPIANAHFIPNLAITAYHRKSGLMPERDADVVAKLTFLYTYK